MERSRRSPAAIGELLDKGAAYLLHDDIYFPVSAAPDFGSESALKPVDDAGAVGERRRSAARRRPRRWTSVLWRRHRGQRLLGHPARRRTTRLAHRVHRDRDEPARRGFDVQGGEYSVDLRTHEHTAAHAEALAELDAVREEELRARRDDRAGREGSANPAGQPGAGRSAPPASTRWRSASRCSTGAATADREMNQQPLKKAEARLARWRAAVDLAGTPPPRRCWPRYGRRWPTISTPRPPSPPWIARRRGPRRRRGSSDTPAAAAAAAVVAATQKR